MRNNRKVINKEWKLTRIEQTVNEQREAKKYKTSVLTWTAQTNTKVKKFEVS